MTAQQLPCIKIFVSYEWVTGYASSQYVAGVLAVLLIVVVTIKTLTILLIPLYQQSVYVCVTTNFRSLLSYNLWEKYIADLISRSQSYLVNTTGTPSETLNLIRSPE